MRHIISVAKSITMFVQFLIFVILCFTRVDGQQYDTDSSNSSIQYSAEEMDTVFGNISNSIEENGESNISSVYQEQNYQLPLTTSEIPLVVQINEQLAREEDSLDKKEAEHLPLVEQVKEKALHNLIKVQ